MAKKKKSTKSKKKIHDENLKQMISRYGTNSMWGEAELYLTYDEVEKYYGKECEEYEPLCGCCKAWVEWQQKGKVTVMFEREKFVKLMFR